MILDEFNRNLTSFLPDSVEGKRFLLAVSGGIDSMCMATLFLQSPLRLQFGIATVNFKLREGDCDLDQELVRGWALRHNIPFHTIDFDTKGYAQEHSVSTQMAARDLRYGWFYQLLEEHKYDYIAIAHNMDDSAETMILNLLRGTGLKGMAGIRRVNGKLVRPLITISRERITQYVKENDVPYRDDKTNFESHYSRNRVRNIIFPEFRKINPSFLETITRTSSYFVQMANVLDGAFESRRGELFSEEGEKLVVSIAQLRSGGDVEYWLYRLLDGRGFNGSQVEDIAAALDGQSGKCFYSPTHEAVLERGELRVYPKTQLCCEEITVEVGGTYTFNGITFRVDVYEKGGDFSPIAGSGRLFFCADEVDFPLTCRGWRSGDRFRPFGMKGFKKLSDFFKDLKMDKRGKEIQPLLLNGEEIVCLPGLRIDDRYKIKTSTKWIAEVNIL